MIVLLLLILGLFIEILMYVPRIWPYRLPFAIAQTATLPGLSLLLFYQQANFVALLFFLVSLLRIVAMLRIAQNRLTTKRLYKVSIRTSGFALLLQAGLIAAMNSVDSIGWPTLPAWYMLAAAQVVVGVLVCVVTFRTLRRLTPTLPESFIPDRDLPTLTVAIPARNETPELVECLTSVLANDYPKLEVIVLDDCSHDKTPELIKQFAHEGVRFIQGEEPSERWLAKNAAYERLATEATGDLLLFCGVDVRFEPKSIRLLVNTMITKDKKMMSVLPARVSTSLRHAVMQPLRYWWEIALPRRLLNRPAVLSTCWLIDRETLRSLGGFKSVSRSVLPERFFARSLVLSDSYGFVRSTPDMVVETTKSLIAQRETVIRMRYPQVHRRLELTFLMASAEVLLLFGPFAVLTFGLLAGYPLLALLGLVSVLLLVGTNYQIIRATNQAGSLLSVVLFPVSVLVELYLGIESAIKYEFSTVEWKGRNICLPVMQVVPKLPKID